MDRTFSSYFLSLPVAMYVAAAVLERVNKTIAATERSRVDSTVINIIDGKRNTQSSARHINLSWLVCSIVASVLRPMQ